MMFPFPIKKVIVQSGEHLPMDHIVIHFDAPSTTLAIPDAAASALFYASKGYALQWVRDNLHIEPEVQIQ